MKMFAHGIIIAVSFCTPAIESSAGMSQEHLEIWQSVEKMRAFVLEVHRIASANDRVSPVPSIEKAFYAHPAPLVAGFYALIRIHNDAETIHKKIQLQDMPDWSLPAEIKHPIYEFRTMFNLLPDKLVSLKQDPRWAGQFKLYLRGVKIGILERLDIEVAKPAGEL